MSAHPFAGGGPPFKGNQAAPEPSFAVAGSLTSRAAERAADAGVTIRPMVRESDLLAEDIFREVVYFERKRSERTGSNLLLFLLDAGSSGMTAGRLMQLADTVAETRATPISGWYRQGSIMGILFLNRDQADSETIRSRFRERAPKDLAMTAIAFPGTGFHGNGDASPLSPFYPVLTSREKNRRLSLFLKRVLDVLGGIAGLLLFLPCFLVLPLLIKASSPGPVLFRQQRIGRGGRPFTFLKFRTMTAGSDAAIHRQYIRQLIREQKEYSARPGEGVVYKIKDDPRVTRIGRFLRKTSLDELPQFFNVLSGEMSLVGPRPPIPYELESYDPWHLRRVMEIKPGITGLWQVTGRSSTTFDEMVRLDLQYAQEWSLWLDIKIIVKTPWAMLAGKGAY